MNRNLIIGVIVIAVIAVGASLVFKTAPSQNMAPKTQTQVTSAPIHETLKPSATGSANSKKINEITVTGSNFKFDPKTVTLKKGEKVKLTFKSADGFHNFVIDELNVRVPITQAGQVSTVELTADKTGTFNYYCSIANHRAMGMQGTLTVR